MAADDHWSYLRAGWVLNHVWDEQHRYNAQVLRERGQSLTEPPREEWTQDYLLGMVTEIGEVLREIQWKRHRRGELTQPITDNIAEELADLTKYVMSLWIVWGFSPRDMLLAVRAKSGQLQRRWQLEHSSPAPGQPVLVVDLDGTTADWFSGISHYLRPPDERADRPDAPSQSPDVRLGVGWGEYQARKEEFESGGGYLQLRPYPDSVRFIKKRHAEGWYIVVCTARPHPKYRRIWNDTAEWLEAHGVSCHELHIGFERRLTLATRCASAGHPVALMEDDPEIIIRASNSGLVTWVRSHAYNAIVAGLPSVRVVTSYDDVPEEAIHGVARQSPGAQDGTAETAGDAAGHADGPGEIRTAG